MTLAGGAYLGCYQVVSFIGCGMGEVCRARDA